MNQKNGRLDGALLGTVGFRLDVSVPEKTDLGSRGIELYIEAYVHNQR